MSNFSEAPSFLPSGPAPILLKEWERGFEGVSTFQAHAQAVRRIEAPFYDLNFIPFQRQD